jgi:glyoxylase-like metal-dependent hydrolase (beta-lactamase superfamily II)
MDTKITWIKVGMVNCYILKEDGCIMIDTGIPGQMKGFLRSLERNDLNVTDIELVILTHGHMDHIGLAGKIKELSKAKLAIHHQEVEWLETGISPVPPGTTQWGKLMSEIGQRIPPIKVSPASADFTIGDDGLSLGDFGISGEVIHTPGHTSGSVSVLLNNGDVFVGDLAMSARFMRPTPGSPIFAEDLEKVYSSWKKLVDAGAKRIFPAHGKPFEIDVLHRLLLTAQKS